MLKYLVMLPIIIFGLALQPIFAQADSIERFVFAKSLTIRSAPKTGQNNTGTLNYGDSIKVTRVGEKEKIGPATDHWYKIDAIKGYVFGAYLLPVPPPDLTNAGIETFVSRLGFQNLEEKTDAQGTITWQKHFNHGVTLKEIMIKMGDGGYFSESHLLVTDITVFQGFLLARAIANHGGLESGIMKQNPRILKNPNGLHYVFDDSNYQIISVQETGDGVHIQFPERAD